MTSSWMAERDRLLAQAQSLSKSASTSRAAPSSVSEKPHDRPLTPQPRPASTAPAPYAPKPPTAIRARHEGEADHQPLTVRRGARTDAHGGDTVPIPLLAGTERDDLQIRVARFRERQTKMAMERQALSEEVRAHTVSKLMRNEGDR